MSTIYEIKLRKARIDTERIQNGLAPIYAAYEKELNAKQANIHRAYDAKFDPDEGDSFVNSDCE